MDESQVQETYVAALQHDLVEYGGDDHLAGVVRRPTGWFRAAVDENYPELSPPESLLSDVKEREEELETEGLTEEKAQDSAWEDLDFEQRYREYIADSEPAQERLADLAERARDGQRVVLVCFEGDAKRCHRHHLVERLRQRVSAGESRGH